MLILAGGLLFTAGPAAGQMSGAQYRVTIPFPFVVDGNLYPAGEYRLQPANSNTGGDAVVLETPTGDHRRFLNLTREDVAGRTEPSVLKFARFEGSFVLTEIKTGKFAGKCHTSIPKTMLKKGGMETVALKLSL